MGSAGEKTENKTDKSSKPQKLSKNDLPESVISSYDKYEKSNWKGTYEGQTPGTKAGSKRNNEPPSLPEFDNHGNKITYREFDVNNKIDGKLRDSERFVKGSDEKIYYTPDHYDTFYEIIS